MSPPLPARDAAPELTVVMPAHNEAGYLDHALKNLVAALRDRDLNFELLVVENGSTDATLATARSFAADDDAVEVLTRPVADYGEAMRAGIVAARGDVVVLFDVDYFDPAFVDEVLPRLRAPDGPVIIVGSKRAPGTLDTRPWPRRVITAGFSTILRIGFRLQVSDTHGMKALRRVVLVPIVEQCRNGTDLFDTELVLRADRAGMDVAEVPVTVGETRPSRTPIAHRIGRTVFGLVRLRIQLWRDDRRLVVTPPRFAAALSEHPVASHAVGEVAGEVLDAFGGDEPDLLVFFVSPHFVGAMDDMTGALRDLLQPRVMLGLTAVGVVGGAHEVEDSPGVSVFAASCPEAQLTPVALDIERTPDGAAITGWPDLEGAPSTLLLLADPFSFPVDGFLTRLRDDRPELQVIGGAASAARGPGGNRLVLDGRVTTSGAVGVFLDGLPVRAVVSQGCRPVGAPYVVTSGEGNRIGELAGRSAIERVQDIAAAASEEDRALMQAGLHLGIVVDEHQSEFQRGDFLVRNVLGGDPDTGAIVVGDDVAVGQTVQFHVRDAAAADEDLRELLDGAEASAALLFTCNGRGVRFFGEPDHDAAVVDQLLGPLPLAGAFCAGEVGPVSGRTFLHGFTASLALF